MSSVRQFFPGLTNANDLSNVAMGDPLTIGNGLRPAGAAQLPPLSLREPGYSVAKKCLEVQAEAEALDPTLRTDSGVRLADEAKSWFIGAEGEIEVGTMLGVLDSEWRILHSVPVGASTTDVDHLIIGPGGVFAVNTKAHRKASIWIGDSVEKVNGGESRHYASASSRESASAAQRLTRMLGSDVAVHPVVAFVDPRLPITDVRRPDNRKVIFIPAHHLPGWLMSLPRVFATEQVDRIFRAADRPDTWHVDPHAADTFRVMPRFERLREEVRRQSASQKRRQKQRTAPRPPRPSKSSSNSATRVRSHRALIAIVLLPFALVALVPIIMAAVMLGTAVAGALTSVPSWSWPLIGLGALAAIASGLNGGKKRRRRR